MLVVTGVRNGRWVRLTDDDCRVRYFTDRIEAMAAAFNERGFLKTDLQIERVDLYDRPSPPDRANG